MRHVWHFIGLIFLTIGIVGIALPIVPTVPFLLVAAWAFARSSPILRQKILDHPRYGHHVRAWQERGVISRYAKIWAVLGMTSGIALSFWVGMPVWVLATQTGICGVVTCYIVTRPRK